MKKIYFFTKTIFQIFLYLFEVVSISILIAYLTTFMENTSSLFDFFERCVMCYTIYQIIVILILTNINDIEKDSTLAYMKILKKCLLYIETKRKYIRENILKDIDYQLENSTFNNNNFRQAYISIKNNIDNLKKENIDMELIKAEHRYESNSLNWKFSFLLRFFKTK